MHPRCAASIVALTLGMLTFAVPSRAGKLEVQPIPLPPNAPVQELHYGRMRGTADATTAGTQKNPASGAVK